MKHLINTILAVFLLTSATLAFANKRATSILYVLYGGKTTVSHANQGQNKYLVKINSPMVYYFTKQPSRTIGHVPNNMFVSLWDKKGKNSFKNDNPNAEFLSAGNHPSTTVELSQPTYNKNTNQMSLIAKPIKNKPMKTGTSKSIQFFIDNSPCFGGATVTGGCF